MPVIPGLEMVLDDPSIVGDRRWALAGNHTAVTRDLVPARLALREALPGPLVRLFAPEHGLDGTAQDMEAVDDEADPSTGVPVRSLYGSTAETLQPTPDDLADVDVLLVDLPDVGTRYYTYAATTDFLMAGCAEAGVELVVLDRPNPIGGTRREGGMVEGGLDSFVGQLPTPVRHGLTLGEIALLLRRERHPEAAVTVVSCRGWRRELWWDETGLPWVPPSPNLPALDTAGIYPGLCLVEATELSEGRGTTRPFHLVGTPGIDPDRAATALRAEGIDGLAFRPARFRPMFQKHAGAVCGGVEIHLVDREALRPVAAGLRLLRVLAREFPGEFAWRSEPYEFVADVPAIDLLTGSEEARRVIEGTEPLEPVLERWRIEAAAFDERVEPLLLYR